MANSGKAIFAICHCLPTLEPVILQISYGCLRKRIDALIKNMAFFFNFGLKKWPKMAKNDYFWPFFGHFWPF